MSMDMLFVLLLIITMLAALLLEWGRPALIVFTVLVIFLLTGILTPEEALKGFANQGMLTIALLFIMAGAVQKYGIIDQLMKRWLNKSTSIKGAMYRFFIPLPAFSAFLNNTPIVVTFTPLLKKWCDERGLSPSKFLIPLSYITILGGTITIIGTSTNLVVHGMLLEYHLEGFTLFQLAIVGIPITVVGLIYIFTFGYKLLPNHTGTQKHGNSEAKEYLTDDAAPESLQEDKVKGWFSIGLLLTMILLVTFNVFDMLQAMALAVLILLFTRLITPEEVKQYIQFDVLLLIASALGIGTAMTKSGLAAWLAENLLSISEPLGLFAMLYCVYLLTSIFTELITNSAAAILMLPIGLQIAESLDLSYMGFAVIITIAASASFITPIGYPTNLIVYRPGNYQLKDYVKAGTPLSVLTMLVTLTIVYLVWF
ncbi:SLC13 family permease [Gracilibacillus alcaliphilus]|uniref:SLC13 family permease n=1 Tax=Gracilibacillus alcaliphilus TaxID=1401441 RepID=UPI001957F086|nr:SLC13 family permease [Gracilibacillus alcaliphilus]MBM7675627.1 anion transporter [Gracilibacillus alcaliphilus]